MEQSGDTRPARDPPRDDVRIDGSPVRCPFCHEGVDVATDEWVACAGCLARHHGECWAEGTKCGACGGAESLARTGAPAATRPIAAPIPAPPTTPAPSSKFERWFGAERNIELTRSFEGEVGEELDEVVVLEARKRLELRGSIERLGRTLTWTTGTTPADGGRAVTVSVTARDGRTDLAVKEGMGPVAGGLYGGLSWLFLFGSGAAATAVGKATNNVALALLTGLVVFAVTVLLVRRLFQRIVRKRRAALTELTASLEREVGARVRPPRRVDPKTK